MIETAKLIEYISGGVAVVFFVKFLMGRRIGMTRDREGRLQIEGEAKERAWLTEAISRDLVLHREFERSVEIVRREGTIPGIFRAQAQRLLAICKQREFEAKAGALEAFVKMLEAAVKVELVVDKRENIGQLKEIEAQKRAAELKELERRNKLGDLDVAEKEQRVRLLKIQADQAEKSSRERRQRDDGWEIGSDPKDKDDA